MSDNNTTHRQVYQREELHKKLWEMANSLRNNMEGSEFKNYVLGLLFYRFLSEHEELQIKELLKDDGISFSEAFKNEDYVQPITDWMIEANGYFIEPKYPGAFLKYLVRNDNRELPSVRLNRANS